MLRMPSLALAALFVAMLTLSAPPHAAAATATTFSGQATVLMGQVAGITLPCLEGPGDGRPCRGVVDTGPIPVGATAANYQAALLCYAVPDSTGCLVTPPNLTGQTLSAEALGATVVASGNAVDANAFVANFSLALAGQQISADILHAHAQAKCTNNGAVVSAGAQTSVTINGTKYTVGESQTQTVPLLGALGVNIGFVVINEGASGPRSGSSIDASALHIVINEPPTMKTDITVAAVHADVICATPLGCPSDHLFVTGGGYFNNTVANVAKAHFTVAGGKNRPWGHVQYKPTGLHVKDPNAILFFASGSTLNDVIGTLQATHPEFSSAINDLGARPGGTKIEGGAILAWPSSSSTVSGGPASGEALALDLGEPGRDDYFEIAGAGGSSFITLGGGFLDGGNIQMHGKC